MNWIKENWHIVIVILLLLNMALSLWVLYNLRVTQARICLAIAAVNDSIKIELTKEIFDENNC